jgi:hypothetical protein
MSLNYREPVYRPLLRRFTDERARDLAETVDLYNRVTAAHRASVWGRSDAIGRINNYIVDQVSTLAELPAYPPLGRALDACQHALLALETTIFATPRVDFSRPLTLKEQVDLNRQLRAQEYFLAHEDRIVDQLVTALTNVCAGLIGHLPAIGGSGFTVPLISLLRSPGDVVERVIGTVYQPELADVGLFTAVQDRLYHNVCTFSGVPLDGSSKKPLIMAGEANLVPEELVRTYLGGTPFQDLLLTPVPLHIPERIRFEHTHIVGGTGHGKTQLLQHLIFNDLSSPEPPALVIVDSQNQMLRKLERLALFAPDSGRLAGRLIIVDPEDDFPPALNMFATRSGRVESYKRIHRETIEADTIQLFNYIFGAIAAELTQKQSTAFAYVTRLILSIPNATVDKLLELMEDSSPTLASSPFASYIAQLDSRAQSFFQNQFFNRSAFGQTKQQIARRLYGVLQVPAFSRMFSARENRLDLFTALQERKTILVNTSKSLLKDASPLFGRFIIARVLAAAFERVAIDEREHTPAYLVIDEAQEYLDDQFEDLLTQARKFKLGVIFAHQTLKQLEEFQAIVASNTSIKLAGGVSDRDARALAPDMRTDAEFIHSMQKRGHSTDFACHVRNLTPTALRLTIPFGTVESAPRMSNDQHAVILEKNRTCYAIREDGTSEVAATEPVATPVAPSRATRNDPDSGEHTEASSKW